MTCTFPGCGVDIVESRARGLIHVGELVRGVPDHEATQEAPREDFTPHVTPDERIARAMERIADQLERGFWVEGLSEGRALRVTPVR